MDQDTVKEISLTLAAFFCAGSAALCWNKAEISTKHHQAITLRLISRVSMLLLLAIALSACSTTEMARQPSLTTGPFIGATVFSKYWTPKDPEFSTRQRVAPDAQGWDCNDYALHAQKTHPGLVLAIVLTEQRTRGREEHMVAMTPDGSCVYDQRAQNGESVCRPWWLLRDYIWQYVQAPEGWYFIVDSAGHFNPGSGITTLYKPHGS